MRTLKRRLSVVLAATMIAASMSSAAMADVSTPTGWQLEKDGWHFYRFSDGKEMKGREKAVQNKWYSFDTNGVMYSDTLVDANATGINEDGTEETVTGKRYAFPDGHLAEGGQWMLLNGDGTKHYHNSDPNDACNGIWYFFKGDGLVDTDSETKRGVMLTARVDETAREKEVHGNTYCFDRDGHMYSRKWNKNHYFQYNGDMAANKYLYIDSQWYHFDESGDASKISKASDADAELSTVRSIEPVVDDVTSKVGETVEIQYQITLATSSNADEMVYKEDQHDVWVLQKTSNKFEGPEIDESGLCTISYTVGTLETEKLRLVIDGKQSAPVTITPSKEDATAEDILTAWTQNEGNENGTAGISTDTARKSLTEYYNTDKDSVKAEYTELADSVKSLDDMYALEKAILVEEPAISDDARKLLPESGKVQITGAALNADKRNSTVTLSVDSGNLSDRKLEQIKEEIGTANELISAPFDITLFIGSDQKSSLQLPVIITMPLPDGFEYDSTVLYHIHGNSKPEELELVETDNGDVSFVTDRFSTYVFVQDSEDNTETPSKPDDNTGTSSSYDDDDDDDDSYSSHSEGRWIKNSTGWWYRNSNGSYPSNTWIQLEYSNVKDWYRFNLEGYLHTGWFTDSDGEIYYLNPVSNGFLGVMLTGWHQIDGYWYYFNPVSNGHKGALLRNTTAPDGYKVNEKGQRIQ